MAAMLLSPPLWAAFLLVTTGAAVAGEAGSAADPCGPAGGTAVAVADVIDGDTCGWPMAAPSISPASRR